MKDSHERKLVIKDVESVEVSLFYVMYALHDLPERERAEVAIKLCEDLWGRNFHRVLRYMESSHREMHTMDVERGGCACKRGPR